MAQMSAVRMAGNNCVKIDTAQIPDGVRDELARTVLDGVRKFFSNMTPEQNADFERWKTEYRKRKAMERQDEQRSIEAGA